MVHKTAYTMKFEKLVFFKIGYWKCSFIGYPCIIIDF